MVSSHPLCLAMKSRFEMLVVKCLCWKVFGRLLLFKCLCCYSRKFFKGVFEKFQFKVAMCFQPLRIKSIMSLCILSWWTLLESTVSFKNSLSSELIIEIFKVL